MRPYWQLKNIHKDEIGVLICNGPSLKGVPTDWLNSHTTLGSNSVYAKEGLIVNYYFLEGAGHLRKPEEREARYPYVQTVVQSGGSTFVNRRFIQYFLHFGRVYSMDYMDDRGRVKSDFSFDPLCIHGTGGNVTFPMLQVAFYFGFNPLLIVGMDHKFDGDDWHFFPDSKVEPFVSMSKDEYESFRVRADACFTMAQVIYEMDGRRILNLTPDTACDVFEKDDISNWL